MRQLVLAGQVVAEVQLTRHWPSTQSLPLWQWAAWLQVPAGRGLHRPPWQVSLLPQSMSAVQPPTQALLMHQAPAPQSALKVQLEGWLLPPPLPVVPPPVPAAPPPVL